jgi:hypothetical protein
VQWRNIRPNQEYTTIRKLFYQEQRKRKLSEFKKNAAASSEEGATRYNKSTGAQNNKRFRENPPGGEGV